MVHIGDLMWAHRLTAPYRFERELVPAPRPEELGAAQVLLRVLALGICGSDLPFFRGVRSPFSATLPNFRALVPGGPLHEVVGEVVASTDPGLEVGAHVVGWASGNDALQEYVVADAEGLIEYDASLEPIEAVIIQPLACAIYALEMIPMRAACRAAVIGQGPIGLLFSHVLKSRGAAAHVTGVDGVDRSDRASTYLVDEMVHATSGHWASHLASGPDSNRPEVVIEAVGHQVGTLRDAVDAVAMNGFVYYFGIPDDAEYPFPMYTFLRKSCRLAAGTTLAAHRRNMLMKAQEHLRDHPAVADGYVTDVFLVDDVNQAFHRAIVQSPDRLKVVLEAGTG